jgi:hypothetical protein
MNLSKSSPRSLALVAAAVLAMAGAAAPVLAQSQSGPRIPLDARGFQISQALMQYHQSAAARNSYRAPAPAAEAEPEAPRWVGIRGPGGRIRYFLLEGPVRVVPFRPGVVAHYPR